MAQERPQRWTIWDCPSCDDFDVSEPGEPPAWGPTCQSCGAVFERIEVVPAAAADQLAEAAERLRKVDYRTAYAPADRWQVKVGPALDVLFDAVSAYRSSEQVKEERGE